MSRKPEDFLSPDTVACTGAMRGSPETGYTVFTDETCTVEVGHYALKEDASDAMLQAWMDRREAELKRN